MADYVCYAVMALLPVSQERESCPEFAIKPVLSQPRSRDSCNHSWYSKPQWTIAFSDSSSDREYVASDYDSIITSVSGFEGYDATGAGGGCRDFEVCWPYRHDEQYRNIYTDGFSPSYSCATACSTVETVFRNPATLHNSMLLPLNLKLRKAVVTSPLTVCGLQHMK